MFLYFVYLCVFLNSEMFRDGMYNTEDNNRTAVIALYLAYL